MEIEKEELRVAIEKIVLDRETSVFKNGTLVQDKSSLQESYRGEGNYEINLADYHINASMKVYQEHKHIFESLFDRFVKKESNKMGISSFVLGTSKDISLTVVDFVLLYVIRAALFLGPKRVSELLVEWQTRNSLAYTVKFYLMGIDVKSAMNVLNNENEKFKILPPVRENFDTKLSRWSQYDMEIGVGAVATVYKQVEPVFFQPNVASHNRLEQSRKLMRDFRDCLSLVLNCHISLNYWWLYDFELNAFNPNSLIASIDNIHSRQGPLELTQFEVNEVARIMPNYSKLAVENPRFKVAAERLIRSIREDRIIDKYIEMRIAMEALFSESKSRSSTHKLLTNCARFLRKGKEPRIRLRKDYSDFLNTASIIIHGDQETLTIKGNSEIENIQSICKEAIMKMLEEGAIPDWRTFALED